MKFKVPVADEFKVYVIEMYSIKSFVLVEMIIGTLLFNLWMRIFDNALFAGTSGWLSTEGLKRLEGLVLVKKP
ncbi:hypothetical protein DCC85_10235 [Paenibacillus sp. CAA11]|uniref:hypothetical protein n=1 Tax=Paenibacillus sp. CAA11 TaxID=1532905 RepID=UPI000D38B188|nr:hypothetical protein [Paenibacillus sp. CAA11]AWB44567.1 hypothetical protein DCC85_10235 [Paenibacillus sp. CAA11]